MKFLLNKFVTKFLYCFYTLIILVCIVQKLNYYLCLVFLDTKHGYHNLFELKNEIDGF